MTEVSEERKLEDLLYNEGFEDELEFADAFIHEGVVPGICMNIDCDYTTMYEPDQDSGWCEFCNTNTVCSGFILMGIM